MGDFLSKASGSRPRSRPESAAVAVRDHRLGWVEVLSAIHDLSKNMNRSTEASVIRSRTKKFFAAHSEQFSGVDPFSDVVSALIARGLIRKTVDDWLFVNRAGYDVLAVPAAENAFDWPSMGIGAGSFALGTVASAAILENDMSSWSSYGFPLSAGLTAYLASLLAVAHDSRPPTAEAIRDQRAKMAKDLPEELRVGAAFMHGPIARQDPRDAFAMLVLADVNQLRRSGWQLDFEAVAAGRWAGWCASLGLDDRPEDLTEFVAERLSILEDEGLVHYEQVLGYQFTDRGFGQVQRVVAAIGDIVLREEVGAPSDRLLSL